MNKIIKWLKESNRYKRLIGGVLTVLVLIAYIAQRMQALELQRHRNLRIECGEEKQDG